MAGKKLDSIAAKMTTPDGTYAAALYFPNVQLLVVSGHYSAPQLMEPASCREAVPRHLHGIERNGDADTKVFVQDMGDPGLSSKRQDDMFDTWNRAGKVVTFDGDPDKQKMSDGDYAKAFAAADEEYARILSALLAEAKK